MSWTDGRIEVLKTLWANGLSATMIAECLGGVTRNAVIGKVHRLGLPGRATTSRTRPAKRRTRYRQVRIRYGNQDHNDFEPREEVPLPPKRKRFPLPQIDLKDAPASLRIATLDLAEHQCRWPEGDPKHSFDGFCGRPARESWCEFHERVVYRTGGSYART